MKTKRWFAMRVDASINMGSGHLMRCITLANALLGQGLQGFILSIDLPDVFKKLLNCKGIVHIPLVAGDYEGSLGNYSDRKYAHSTWLEHSEFCDIECTRKAIQKITQEIGCLPAFIVVDHYALGEPWEAALGESAPILAIDDLNDRAHSARWLLDQTTGKTQIDYQGLIKQDTHLLIGSEYALLREEFAHYREQAAAKRRQIKSVQRILVTLGGSDQNNITAKILACLNELDVFADKIFVDVVIGSVNPHAQRLREQCAKLSFGVELSVAVDDMAERMLNADFCIGAAGATAWERCAMGLPAINVILADNQRAIAKNLADAGAAFAIESADVCPELTPWVLKLLNDGNLRKEMSECALSLCDGLGVQRVVEVLLNEY